MSAASRERRLKRRAMERAATLTQEAKRPDPWPEAIPSDPLRMNVYTCPDCGTETVTIDLHKGVTPYLLGRPWASHIDGCTGGPARSSFYRPRQGHGPPTLEWYAPTRAQAGRAGPGMFEHAAKGGLFVRPRNGVVEVAGG